MNILRVRNIITALLVIGSLSAAAQGQRITLNMRNAPLQKVFKEISHQTGTSIVYSESALKTLPPVTIAVKNATLSEVMDKCLKDQPFDYTIEGNVIVVRQKTTTGAPGSADARATTPIDVKARIINENGEPVLASIMVKGTNKGTTSNSDGYFELKNVDDHAVLLISATNIEPREVTLNGNDKLNIVSVKTKNSSLDEVQIIAYGQTTKRFQTGNVTTVKGEDIAKQPVTNPLLALQGRVPGLFITQANGLPGGAVTVRVQGQNSISNGNDPLYVIDGIPYLSQLPNTGIDGVLGASGSSQVAYGNGNPLNYLDPLTIESIEILKDADATAIYGSMAANGAILITTKKGQAGKMQVNINLQNGWGNVTRTIPMMNTRQYLEMRREAFNNDNKVPGLTDYDINGFWDSTRYTNWQKQLIGGTAQYENASASVSGGTTNLQYLIAGTWHRETTVFPGNFSDQKGSVYFNLSTMSANQKFSINFSGSYQTDQNQLPQSDLTQTAVLLEPDAPALYNMDGSLNWAINSSGNSTWNNPLSYTLMRYKNNTNNLLSNAVLSYKIFRGLSFRASVGYNKIATNDFLPSPLIALRPERRATSQRTSLFGNRDFHSWIAEPQLTYDKKIGKGKINLLLGSTLRQDYSNSGYLEAQGFVSDALMENRGAAATLFSVSSAIAEYKYAAFFGRLTYQWNNKYVLNVTARRDGTSRFGSKNQFHNFESAGAAWIFTEEPFFKNLQVLSFGKLHGSFGTTGSDQIGNYQFLSLYNNLGNNGIPYQNGNNGLTPNNLPNPYLEWEETRKLQGGIDLGFFRNRILFSAVFARNRSSNELLSYALPEFVGFTSIARNFPATVQNTSWELSLQTINIRHESIEWTSSANFTIPRNKLLAFPNLSTSSYASSLIIGQPIGLLKGYNYIGVDPAAGVYQFYDSHGTVTSNPNASTDRTLLISNMPRFYGGLDNTVTYKKLSFDFLIQFVKQIGRNTVFYNGTEDPGQFFSGSSNQPVWVLNRWQKPGDITSIQKYSTAFASSVSKANLSSKGYADASFIRLKNAALSYALPGAWMHKIHFETCKLFIQGQNLLTFTHYKGLDPENQGLTSLPPLRVVIVGVQVQL